MKTFFIYLSITLAFALPAGAQEPETPTQIGVAEFFLARDDGTGKAGEAVGGFFTTDVPIYCVVQLDSALPTTVKMNLIVISVPGIRSGTHVVSTSYTTKENQNRVNFSGRPAGQWLAGRYRADIYVGTTLAVSREFAVQATTAPKPAAEGVTRTRPGAKPRTTRRLPGT